MSCTICGRRYCDGHGPQSRRDHEPKVETKLHVDGTLSAANRALELQTENEQLKAKLAEHELLFGVAIGTDDFLQQLLNGLGEQLPSGTPRSVDGIVGAVANMALELDARKDAADPAFDEIIKLCGLAKTWEYPGQVVRDVEDALKKRDERIAFLEGDQLRLIKERESERNARRSFEDAAATYIDTIMSLRACVAYARDRRGGMFDFDEWISMVEKAMTGAPLAGEVENAQAKEASAWQAVASIRKARDEAVRKIEFIEAERAKDLHVMTRQGECIEELRAKLDAKAIEAEQRVTNLVRLLQRQSERVRIAEAMRDDALAASRRDVAAKQELLAQKDGAYRERDQCVAAIAAFAVNLGWDAWLGRHEPDPKWDQDWMNIVFIQTPAGQVSWHIHDSEVRWFSFLTDKSAPWDGHTTPQKYERLGVAIKTLDLTRRPRHSRDCGTKYRGCAPDCAFDAAQQYVVEPAPGQCPWILDDEDPDEGYWHCKHKVGHVGVHETEFGKGRDQRWKMRGNLLPGDTSKAQKPPRVSHYVGATLGGEDFVGKSAEERREMIMAVVMGDDEPDMDVPRMTELRSPEAQAQLEAVLAECECSLKYRELAPGVHAMYCPFAGRPLAKEPT